MTFSLLGNFRDRKFFGEVLGPVLLWGPPLGDDPGAAVKSSSLLVVSTLNSTDIFLNPVGTIFATYPTTAGRLLINKNTWTS